jgi:hypothetical protein
MAEDYQTIRPAFMPFHLSPEENIFLGRICNQGGL